MDGFRLANGLSRESHAECSLDPQDQFSPSQAVDPQIALDPAGRTYIDQPDALGMQFAHELRDKRNHVAFAQRLLSQCGRRFRLMKPLQHA